MRYQMHYAGDQNRRGEHLITYPSPDPSLVSNWQSSVDIIYDSSAADHSIVRIAHPTSLEVIAASPVTKDTLSIGQREQRNGNHYCEAVVQQRQTVSVPDAAHDARWDGCTERRAGYSAYCGTPLLWPDAEAFGTLAMLKTAPFSEDQLRSGRRLLENLASGMTAQLALLYHAQKEHHQNTHDALTGLPKLRVLREVAQQQMRKPHESSSQLWLLVWTIDELNAPAKTFTAGAADTFIRSIAERASRCIRLSDTLARIDEHRFALLISDANEFVATAVADRIRRNVRRVSVDLPQLSQPGISVGISPSRDQETFDEWFGRAQTALDEAAKAGSDQTLVKL